MEKNRTILMLAAMGLLAIGAAGCASKEAMTGKESTDTVAASAGISSSAVSPTFTEGEDAGDERMIAGSLISNRLILFDYDKSVVLPEYLPIVSAHSTFMVADRGKSIILQGNADERGSDEYNLALGQRRSDSVKEVMLSSGVLDRQIEAISFGESRPRALGHDEAAWRENRRVEILYTDE